MPQYQRNRTLLGIILLGVIITGLGSRGLDHRLPDFIAANAGDALWTVAVYLSLAIIRPDAPAWKLGLTSLAISFAVEFSQLVHHPWLDFARGTLPGKLLLGRGFLPLDLIRYFVGAVLATAMDRRLVAALSKRQA